MTESRTIAEPVTMRKQGQKSILHRVATFVKFTYSSCLIAFALVLVTAGIFTKQTVATGERNINPIVAYVAFWLLIAWLAVMEGGQGAIVGLQSVDPALYVETHPCAVDINKLAHKGDNIERFIIGRQFLVVLVVFVTNMMASFVVNASVLGLPTVVCTIFLSSNLAVIIVTVVFGQLISQVNAAHCMLDFINNYFMLFTTYASLAVEMSGFLHSVFLVQILFSRITGKPIQSDEPPRSRLAKLFFWARVIMSLALLGFAFAVTFAALFQGKTNMWKGVPTAVSVALLFVLMAFVGMIEGMQIALFTVVKLHERELADHHIAARNCKLAFNGTNIQAYVMGRQICVTVCMFVIARITSVNVDISSYDSENIFGVKDIIQSFFNTGLLGAVIVTVVATLAWRVIASSFPIAFLSNPLVYPLIRLCLLVEASGVCSASWLLANGPRLLFGYQLDEVYIGSAYD